jgi:hypothetical protein
MFTTARQEAVEPQPDAADVVDEDVHAAALVHGPPDQPRRPDGVREIDRHGSHTFDALKRVRRAGGGEHARALVGAAIEDVAGAPA